MLHQFGHSIKNQLRYLFFIGLILDMLLLSFIVFYYWKSSIDEALFFSQEETTRQVVQKISDFMNVPLRLNATNQYFIASHLINLNEPQTAARFFASVMQPTDSNVYSFSYGRADGSYFGVRRNKQNQLEFMRSDKETQYHSVYYALDDTFTIHSVMQHLSFLIPAPVNGIPVRKKAAILAFPMFINTLS
jgi:two-component system, sensor histidine kinase and response regulator